MSPPPVVQGGAGGGFQDVGREQRNMKYQPTPAYISLGSNLGDTRDNLRKALNIISDLDGISLVRASTLYMTEPQGMKDQPWFANQVVKLSCGNQWTSRNLLETLLTIESDLGRVRTERWGPRSIDLDLLLFGSEISDDPRVTLPHPRMQERAFVLIPLLEIEPDLHMPDGIKAARLVDAIPHTVEDAIIRQA